MRELLIPKIITVTSLFTLVAVPVFQSTAFATSSTGFDPSIDGLVTNFENYQSFGGKTGVAIKQVSYNVFLPSGMGFDPSKDTLEMLYDQGGGQSIAYESNSPSASGTCKQASNGYNCTATWVFANSYPALTQGTYNISFVALNNQTMRMNGIYMDLLNGSGSQPIYATTGQVFINEPLTTPYASFDSSVQSLYTLVDQSSPTSLTFNVNVNVLNSPTKVDFYLDNQLVHSDSSPIMQPNTNYTGGQEDQFTYTLNNLSSLSNGNHVLSAMAVGNGYSVPVVTQDGQSQVNIVAAYGTNQSCSSQISDINTITKSVISQETSELNQIQTIDNQAIAYFSKHTPSISNYSQLVNATNTDNKNVYTDLAVLVKDNSFQCSNISSQITTFISDLNKVYNDLNTYQTDSINLLNRAGGL